MSMSSNGCEIVGSCACGSTQLQIGSVSPATPVVDCHCPKCRAHHVSAFSSYLIVPKDDATIEGDSITSIQDSCDELGKVERIFCKQCYTKIATRKVDATDDENIMLCLGSLNDDSIPASFSDKWTTDRQMWQETSTAKWPRALPTMNRHGLLPPDPLTVTGSCGCGKCSYKIPFVPESMELQHCYCKLCRQLSGSAFQTWVPIYHEDFRWTCQEPELVRTTSHGQRHICTDCGGVLTIVYDSDPDCVWPAAGGFDDATLPPNESILGQYLSRVVHICCTWKQDWYELPHDGMNRIDYAGE